MDSEDHSKVGEYGATLETRAIVIRERQQDPSCTAASFRGILANEYYSTDKMYNFIVTQTDIVGLCRSSAFTQLTAEWQHRYILLCGWLKLLISKLFWEPNSLTKAIEGNFILTYKVQNEA